MNLKVKETVGKIVDAFRESLNVNNTNDTWVPVWKWDGSEWHLQHRVIPTEKTKTMTATTNAQGAVALDLNSTNMVRAVACTSNVNLFGIPFKYNNSVWYAKIVDWHTLASQNNTSVTLVIHYA